MSGAGDKNTLVEIYDPAVETDALGAAVETWTARPGRHWAAVDWNGGVEESEARTGVGKGTQACKAVFYRQANVVEGCRLLMGGRWYEVRRVFPADNRNVDIMCHCYEVRP